MDQNMIIVLVVALLALVISFYSFFIIRSQKKSLTSTPGGDSFSTRPLQLQAYERLVMFSERIALPNIVSRLHLSVNTAREMQVLLIESIKQEFEYNASQQIYVSPAAWEAVSNLKEQNLLIINQVGKIIEPTAPAKDLAKALMDFVMTQQKGALHSIVLEALNYEAKKLMK